MTEIVATVDPTSHTLEAENKLSALVKHAKELVINNQDDANAAGTFLKDASKAKRELEAQKKKLREPFNDGLKRLSKAFEPALSEYEQVINLVKAKISDFLVEQERLANEAQAKAALEAEKERKRLKRLAENAAKRGDVEKAEEFFDRADHADAAAVAPVAQKKVAGVRRSQDYVLQVNNIQDLARAVGEGTIPANVLDVNITNLKRLIKAYDGNTTIPGVSFTSTTKIGA